MLPATSRKTPEANDTQCSVEPVRSEGRLYVATLAATDTAALEIDVVWTVVGHVGPPFLTSKFPLAPLAMFSSKVRTTSCEMEIPTASGDGETV